MKVHKVIQPSKATVVMKKANKLGLEHSVGQEAVKIAVTVMLTGCLEGNERRGAMAD